MKIMKRLTLPLLIVLVAPSALSAQGFGEYGRIVGGVGQIQGNVSHGGLQTWPGNGGGKGGVVGGIGDVGRPLAPSALVVASIRAALYPLQDEESEKIAELSQGDSLVLLGQTDQWYMVKTQKGLTGWVKSADVRAEGGKN